MNIFISNLNYSIRDHQLQDLFSEFGEIASARVIMDRETGRSRGFGFVEMTSDSDAQNAIDTLNGKEVEGKAINVTEARPREEKPRRNNNDRFPRRENNKRW